MRYVYPDIDYLFDFSEETVYSLIIENPRLLLEVMNDIQEQGDGKDGKGVISDGNKLLPFQKSVEGIFHFFPFSINQKSLVNKVNAILIQKAISAEFYHRSMELMGEIERYLDDLSFSVRGDLKFTKLSVEGIIKSCGAEFQEEYDSLGEKLIDYFELVTELDRSKLFFLYNLRSVMEDEEMVQFIDTVKKQGYNVIMIESVERTLLLNEKRIVVDDSLCVIQ